MLDQQAFFLEGTDGLGADLHLHFLSIDEDGLFLEVWLPDFAGTVQRKRHVVAVLLALAS